MSIFKKIISVPVLPQRIKKLEDLAYNLWWSWNPKALKVFEDINPELWSECRNSPITFLRNISIDKLSSIIENPEYLRAYDNVIEEFENYMNTNDTWFNSIKDNNVEYQIAYFSAEYGLSEMLPIYSGGLGVLSGDHCKSAGDLGLPFTAIGLLYKHGYFIQHINHEGRQDAKFIHYDVSDLPVRLKKDSSGNDITISIDFPERTVHVRVWEVAIGRINLYLLDTDISSNNSEDRSITSVLYGGNQELRITQEIVLGIGGIRMLYALGINPTVFHLNEGHSAFCALELIRRYIEKNGLSFDEAKEIVKTSTVFTTHTPVPAGSDRFPLFLIDKYFHNFYVSLKISRDSFVKLGCSDINQNSDVFNMTILALKMSGKINGVSKLHGIVSRNIFNEVWPCLLEEEVPIGHVTNGVHTLTWLDALYKDLFDKYLDNEWINSISSTNTWKNIDNIPDQEIWEVHDENKRKMISFIKKRLQEERTRNNSERGEIRKLDNILNPNALTISFARRFATYKRATLIFKDKERLKRILNIPGKPVQIIFAGKAHPADYPGQDLIKYIYDISRQDCFRGKIVFVENYDMALAKHLITGSDVWLNNPQKLLEASGTSGQKAAINGVINLSVLDGWWAEGYGGNNGWAIGDNSCCEINEVQDNIDSDFLYDLLENEIIPLFYNRNDNDVPEKWVRFMKNSIKSCAPAFSTMRMVQDYTQEYYLPTAKKKCKMLNDVFNKAKGISHWKSYILDSWDSVKISHKETAEQTDIAPAGKEIQVYARVNSEKLEQKDLIVEVFYGKEDENGIIENPTINEMSFIKQTFEGDYEYEGSIAFETAGDYKYTFRVFPYHVDLNSKFEMGLIKWAE
jgi:starch phosphorylase